MTKADKLILKKKVRGEKVKSKIGLNGINLKAPASGKEK